MFKIVQMFYGSNGAEQEFVTVFDVETQEEIADIIWEVEENYKIYEDFPQVVSISAFTDDILDAGGLDGELVGIYQDGVEIEPIERIREFLG